MNCFSRRFLKASILVLASVLAASNGWIIDCQYSTNSWGPPAVTNVYSCQATFTDDGSPDITQVTGNLDIGKTLDDVLFFQVQSNGYGVRTYTIPSNFGTVFPNLMGIVWSNTKLEVIKASDLQAFSNLVLFNAAYNFIRHLDGDLFKYNPNLQQIDFSGNYIDFIGPGLLTSLSQLTSAMWYSNICFGQVGMMMGSLGQYYTVAQMQADLDHLCGTLVLPGGSGASGVCSANCTARFDAIETKVSIIETRLTAPWYEKLKWFFKTAFGL